jgi:CheY-like chemotaxis protein
MRDVDMNVNVNVDVNVTVRGKLLFIDDEPHAGKACERLLRREHDVATETRAADALARIERGETFDLVLCDLMMPGMTGMAFYDEVVRRDPSLAARIVFITGGAFTEDAARFCAAHRDDCFDKPMGADALRNLVASRVQRARQS